MNQPLLSWVRISFSALVVAAVATQVTSLVADGVFNPTRFFAFFTVLSNLTAAAVFAEGARRQFTGRPPLSARWRGAAVVFMTVTYIVFALLLRGLQEELQTNIVWVDTVLHRAMPVAVMMVWLVDPPTRRLSFRQVLPAWLVPPLIWTVFTMLRGAYDGWYPYPFLNPRDGGYLTVAGYAVAILLLFLVVIWGVAASANARTRLQTQSQGTP